MREAHPAKGRCKIWNMEKWNNGVTLINRKWNCLVICNDIACVELPSGELALPMLALLSVFWSCRGTTVLKTLLKTSTVALKLGLSLKLAQCYRVRRGRAEVDHSC